MLLQEVALQYMNELCAAVQIYSNHWGYFEFRLCPLRSPTSAGELAALSEACFAQHQLLAVATDTGVAAGNKVWLVDGLPGMTFDSCACQPRGTNQAAHPQPATPHTYHRPAFWNSTLSSHDLLQMADTQRLRHVCVQSVSAPRQAAQCVAAWRHAAADLSTVGWAAGTQYIVKSSWKLPAGVVCPRCVLQWRYVTGHMC